MFCSNMKLVAFVLVFSLTVFTACAAVGYRKIEFDSGKFKVMWMYDKVTDNLTFHLEVKTVGWVGFGFGRISPNFMNDYDVVIGGVTDGGVSYLTDYYTTGRVEPTKDGSQDYTLINATESGGWTRLNITRKADTGDQKDIKITAGDKIHFIWAYRTSGDANTANFGQHSTRRWSDKVEIIQGPTITPTITPTTMAYTKVLTMDGGNYEARWNYDQAKKEYSFYLKVKTTGWVAFGFAKVAPNNMQGYDVAIGGVTSGGTAYIDDFYTAGRTKPAVDQSNDFTLIKGEEKGGYTELWFTRKADTGDSGKDLTLTAGTKVFIVWAYNAKSDADNTNSFTIHSKRGFSAAKLDLSSGGTGGVSLVTYSFVAIAANLFIAVRGFL